MHAGEDSEFYLRKGYRVVAVEANPRLCELAERRLHEHVASGRLTIVNRAIAASEGRMPLYVDALFPDYGTNDRLRAERNLPRGAALEVVQVDAVPFSELLQVYGIPYYLKVDIEGADLLCVAGLASSPARPRFISIESSQTSFDELFEQLASLWALGYRRYKIVPQHTVAKQRCPVPAREGLYVDHRFGEFSSGLFGEELPGRWLDVEAALSRYRRLFRRYRLLGGEGLLRRLPRGRRMLEAMAGWHDLHAVHSESHS